MHINNIHCMLEELAELAKMQFKHGAENINTEEMGKVADIIKDLSEAEYYSKISKAMDEAEYGEEYDVYGPYEDEYRRGYRGQRRDSKGRYMSRRRGYDEKIPMDYEHQEHLRDVDRHGMGRMYYPEEDHVTMQHERDHREGRSGMMRKSYMEAKEIHKGNSTEDKQAKLRELEAYMSELSGDITEMIHDATPEEKNMLKTKIQTLAQKIS